MGSSRRAMDMNDADQPDIESAGMGAYMNDILHSSSTSGRENSRNSQLRGDTSSSAISITSNRPRSSVPNTNRRQSSTGLGSEAAIHQKHPGAGDFHVDEIDGAVVVGSRGGRKRRRSTYLKGDGNGKSQMPESGRQRSSNHNASSSRQNSKGVLELINDGIGSVGPAVWRSSVNVLKQGGSTSNAKASSTKEDSLHLNPGAVTPGSSGEIMAKGGSIESAAEAGGGNWNPHTNSNANVGRRGSLLKFSTRSKAAAVVVSNYEEDPDAEADELRREGAMNFWTLEFYDPILEKAFRRHYRSWVIPRIRVGVQIQIALNLLFGALELIYGYSAGTVIAVLCLRLTILVNLTVLSSITLSTTFHKIMDPSTVGCYTVNSLLLVAISYVGSAQGTEQGSQGLSIYFFFEGRWSLPSSLMFIVVVYHISGLRFIYANIVAWTHYLLLWVVMLGGFCCTLDFSSFFTQSAAIAPILMLLSMMSSNTGERQIRGDFVLRCNISMERARADEICTSMLPPHVSELLKDGSAVEDVLEEYPEITILFCYITGFKELTTSCDPYDVVDFVNSLFTKFDKCTDFNHVYKLEAIDCSYLCCAGGGQEMGLTEKNDHLAPPADRIWDMALSMLAVAAHGSRLPGTVGSTEPGGKVVLKIGIHTGRAVGGVSGVKSYSYHLFGDTINMASRTASTGVAGRVQLSKEAYDALSPEKRIATEIRKGVSMKGKGLMDTYIGIFEVDGIGLRLWRNYRRFEKMTKVYDPNFQLQHSKSRGGGRDRGGEGVSAEGKLEQIRVKKLKFTLKDSNYEHAESTRRSNELEAEYQHQYNASRLPHFQIFLFCALACVCASIYIDFFNQMPRSRKRQIMGLRVFVTVVLIGVLAATKEPRFINCIQPAGASLAAIFCATLNALLLLVPEYHMMDMNLISVITISLLMDLRYIYVLLVNVLDVLMYTTAILIAGSHQTKDVVGYLLFVYGAALVGSYACHKREREFRYSYLHKRILKDNKVKSEALLKNMFPNVKHIAALVRNMRVVDHLEDVTIMFSDLKGYTEWASMVSPREVYRILNKVYTAFDTHLDGLGVYKLDTIGDAFVVVAGLDGFKSKEDHAMAMVKYAFRMLFELERIKNEEDLNFEMRIGLHTGPCIGGVIGRLKPRYLCWGRTPLISNMLEAAGTPGSLLVSSATFAQLNKQVLITRGLKFRPGDPLHVKTFEDIADEEVTTFFIEMDSITAFTILANEIAEERASVRCNRGDVDDNGVDPFRRGRASPFAPFRLKRMFHGRDTIEDSSSQLFDFGMTKGEAGGGAGGRRHPGRRESRLNEAGLNMTTQSAYVASPPSSPEYEKHQEPRYSEGPKPPQPSEAGERVVGSAKRRASSAGGITQSRRRASSLPFGRALDFHLGSLGTSRDVAVALNAADAVPVIAASKRSGESRHRNVEADDVPTVAASNNPGNNKVGNSTGAGGGEQPLGNITRHASFEGDGESENSSNESKSSDTGDELNRTKKRVLVGSRWGEDDTSGSSSERVAEDQGERDTARNSDQSSRRNISSSSGRSDSILKYVSDSDEATGTGGSTLGWDDDGEKEPRRFSGRSKRRDSSDGGHGKGTEWKILPGQDMCSDIESDIESDSDRDHKKETVWDR